MPCATLRHLFSVPGSRYRKLYQGDSTTIWQVKKGRLRGSTASRFTPSVTRSTLRSKASESHPHSGLLQEALWVQPAVRTGQAGGTENSGCHGTQNTSHRAHPGSAAFYRSPEKQFCLFMLLFFWNKICHFELHSLGACHIFTMLGNNHHYLVTKYLQHPERKSHEVVFSPSFPSGCQ